MIRKYPRNAQEIIAERPTYYMTEAAKPLPTSTQFFKDKPSWVPKYLAIGEVFHEKGSGQFVYRARGSTGYIVFENGDSGAKAEEQAS